MRHIFAISCLLIWAPLAAAAQYATLVANNISLLEDGNTLVADGNVEVHYEGDRLIARKITYDQAADTLDITGPVTLIDRNGTVLTGQSAQLSRNLRNGIIRGARFTIDGQMQVAATEVNRLEGSHNQLYKAVASSCRVCSADETPLWQIRAHRIIHDQDERQLYFKHAFFELAGLPIAYFPRLRMPDPTVRRYTGFLTPEIKVSSTLGAGVKLPYFITLGDHADLRLTPYLSPETRTLESRFRREFSFGSLQANGAFSVDSLRDGGNRSYLFAEGRFHLPRDFDFNVDLRQVSDVSYLLAYGYSDTDRLSNGMEVTRTSNNEYVSLGFENLRSLRDSEIPIEDTLATRLGRFTYERRLRPSSVGGETLLSFDLEGHERTADNADAFQAACNAASAPECTARDVARAGVLANWRRDWMHSSGVITAVEGQVATDFYWIGQDPRFASQINHTTPTAAFELRWPMSRANASGTVDILEPVMQISWTGTDNADVPNDDSKLVEFDEGNLLELSRFPGSNRYERGSRMTLGLNWLRPTSSGAEYSTTIGRVFRHANLDQFTAASGLGGHVSDWLAASQAKMRRLTIANRSLFEDSLDFSKSETQIGWRHGKFSTSGSFIFVVDDPAEGRTGNTSELNLGADYKVNRHWTTYGNARHDGNTGRTTNAGLGLSYRNECLLVNFSLSHRFTSAVNVEPTTEFAFWLSLNGFGRDGRQYVRGCYGHGGAITADGMTQ